MMKPKATHQSKFMKIITMPIRALAKARDFYVRSMNNYADNACYGGVSGFSDPLPRSFSTASTRSNDHDDDFRELVRAASTTKLGNRIDLSSALSSNANDVHLHGPTNNHRSSNNSSSGYKGVPRSASVGMAKIEEDKPIEFNDDDILGIKKIGLNNSNDMKNTTNKFGIFPRSRSYAVGSTKRTSPVF